MNAMIRGSRSPPVVTLELLELEGLEPRQRLGERDRFVEHRQVPCQPGLTGVELLQLLVPAGQAPERPVRRTEPATLRDAAPRGARAPQVAQRAGHRARGLDPFRSSFAVDSSIASEVRRSAWGTAKPGSEAKSSIVASSAPVRIHSFHDYRSPAASHGPTSAIAIVRRNVLFPEPLSPRMTCQPGPLASGGSSRPP